MYKAFGVLFGLVLVVSLATAMRSLEKRGEGLQLPRYLAAAALRRETTVTPAPPDRVDAEVRVHGTAEGYPLVDVGDVRIVILWPGAVRSNGYFGTTMAVARSGHYGGSGLGRQDLGYSTEVVLTATGELAFVITPEGLAATRGR